MSAMIPTMSLNEFLNALGCLDAHCSTLGNQGDSYAGRHQDLPPGRRPRCNRYPDSAGPGARVNFQAARVMFWVAKQVPA